METSYRFLRRERTLFRILGGEKETSTEKIEGEEGGGRNPKREGKGRPLVFNGAVQCSAVCPE